MGVPLSTYTFLGGATATQMISVGFTTVPSLCVFVSFLTARSDER